MILASTDTTKADWDRPLPDTLGVLDPPLLIGAAILPMSTNVNCTALSKNNIKLPYFQLNTRSELT
jgi:hypothetical protein